MSDKPEVLCKLKKTQIKEELPKLIKIILPAKFVCTKCLRTANDKRYLCKPKKTD
jgi:hypothetical protein